MSVSNGPNLGVMINALTGDNFDTDFRKFLRLIDTLLMGSVKDRTHTAPPGSPSNGDRYIVAASPTGAFSGHAASIATWTTDDPANPSGVWEFRAPKAGWIVYSVADTAFYSYDGTSWSALASGGGGGSVSSVFTRTGAVVAASGDYAASQVTNDSSVTGSTVKDALNTLLSGGGGGGAVTDPYLEYAPDYNNATHKSLASNNAILLIGVLTIPFELTFDHLAFELFGGDGSNSFDVGIYDASGNLKCHTGATVFSASGPHDAALTASCTLSPGTYILAVTGATVGSFSIKMVTIDSGSGLGLFYSTSTTSTGSTLPSTVTLSSSVADGNNAYRPIAILH